MVTQSDEGSLVIDLNVWRPGWWSLAVEEGQRELADNVFRLYAREDAFDRRRRCFREATGLDRELWQMLERMGCMDLSLPADFDTAVLVAYAGGLCLAPVEYGLSLRASLLSREVGSPADAVEGAGVEISLPLVPVSGRHSVQGYLALNHDVADRFVAGGVAVAKGALDGRSVDLVDGTRTMLVARSTVTPGLGNGDDREGREWVMEMLAAAEACGIARGALHMARNYSQGRVQFGRPISSFQAIQHKLADVFLWTEAAELTAVAAGRVLARGTDWGRQVWGDHCPTPADACVVALHAMDLAIRHGHQVMGGYGVTEDYDMHLFTRRSRIVRAQIAAEKNPYREVSRQWLA